LGFITWMLHSLSKYFIQLIAESEGHTCRISLWKHITVLKRVITDSTEFANSFNNYLIQSVEELAQNFETVKLSQANITDFFQSFYIKEVDREKVAKTIKKSNHSKAKDLFGLDIAVNKTHISTLIKPITHLKNLSIRVGKFPQTWKTAVITPILKVGAPVQ